MGYLYLFNWQIHCTDGRIRTRSPISPQTDNTSSIIEYQLHRPIPEMTSSSSVVPDSVRPWSVDGWAGVYANCCSECLCRSCRCIVLCWFRSCKIQFSGFYPRYASARVSCGLCVSCLSNRCSIKTVERIGLVLTWELLSTYPILCYKDKGTSVTWLQHDFVSRVNRSISDSWYLYF